MGYVEFIEEYVKTGDGYQHYSNNGLLIRCNDCEYFNKTKYECKVDGRKVHLDSFCDLARKG